MHSLDSRRNFMSRVLTPDSVIDSASLQWLAKICKTTKLAEGRLFGGIRVSIDIVALISRIGRGKDVDFELNAFI